MGGFLAQPTEYYPSVFSPDGIFAEYPYLLPNLVAAGVVVLAIIQGIIFLEETNPALIDQDDEDDDFIDERTPLRWNRNRNRDRASEARESSSRRPSFMAEGLPTFNDPGFDIAKSQVGTIHSIKIRSSVETARDSVAIVVEDEQAPQPKTFNRNVLGLTVALVLMSYHTMGFASIFPVYLLDEPLTKGLDLWGGLGNTVHDAGIYMAINGLSAMFNQAVIFPLFVQWFGVYKSVVILTILFPVSHLIMPLLSLLPKSVLPVGIYLTLMLQNFFTVLIYPCLLILLKNATPSSRVLGQVNGLAMSACSGARTIAPPLIGIIYSSMGSAAAWWSGAVVAGAAIFELYWIPKESIDSVAVENVLTRDMEEA